MSSLTNIEKMKLEKLFEMNSGYVSDFSNRKLADFVFSSVKKDIYAEKYNFNGDSKANRIRAFWTLETDQVVGQLTDEMLEYWKTLNLMNGTKINENEQLLFDECLKIASRLLGKIQKEEKINEDEFINKEFKNISLDKLDLGGQITGILEQRIEEIRKCLNAKVSLSVVFLCGSTLEGILLGIATKNPKIFNQSKSSPKKDGQVLSFPDWTLSNFIDVSRELQLIGEDVKKFSHALRDFRNYIHPYQQLASNFDPDQHTAKICWQVLQAAIYQLSNQH